MLNKIKYVIANKNWKKGNSFALVSGRSLNMSSLRMGGKTFVNDVFKVGLSIDGGGMRGIIPATMMSILCEHNKKQIWQMFDSIGGTSIGGILALGCAGTLDGKNPIIDHYDMPKIFSQYGTQIFNSNKFLGIWNNLIDKARYDPHGLESLLQNYFQNSKLSDVLPGVHVLVTAVRRQPKQGGSSAKLFRSNLALLNPKKNFFMRDVARATSAAPIFFPSAEIKNLNGTKSYSLIDGGIGQNNPSKFVLEDIKKEAINSGGENNFFLLSLGTGQTKGNQGVAKNAGLLGIIPLIDHLGDSCTDYVEKDIINNYQGQYLRVQPIINCARSEADLDSTKPEILKIYQDSARQSAEEILLKEEKYGSYGDRCFADWLNENAARKKDYFI